MSTLGRELISGDTVAVTELVKNAYDANAGFVVVNISGDLDSEGAIAPETGSLSILDDGHGMDADRIVNTWLEPATPFRRRANQSPTRRRVLGEKGVGRFAAARLGDRMELMSRVSGGEEVYLGLDWRDFDDDSKYLEDIELDLRVGGTNIFAEGGEAERYWLAQPDLGSGSPNLPASGHGTLIRVSKLQSRWSLDLIKDVRRSLSMLVSPFAADRGVADDFEIFLDVPSAFAAQGGAITSTDLLKQHHYSLSAEVMDDGTATVLLTLKDGSERELDFKLRNDDGGEDLRCGPFEIFLYVWDRDPDSMTDLAEHFGGRKLAKDVLDSASGVSIYRDGFRVLPYGETGNDWLSLNARRVQNPTLRLSNNQIVGYLLIGRDTNPALVDQSNREGLVEGPALADLRHIVRSLLSKLETERYNFRPRRPKERSGSLFRPADLTPLRTAILETAPDATHLRDMVNETQRDFNYRLRRVSDALSRYHRQATLGGLIDRVIHELTQPIFAITQATLVGLHTLEDVPKPIQTSLGAKYDELADRFSRIAGQADAMNTVVKRIEPFGGRKRGRPTPFVIEDAINETAELLSSQIVSAGITLDLPVTTHVVTLDRAECQEILINLLDNSIYWLTHSKAAKKIVSITVVRNPDSSLSIIVEDSGPGILDEHHESVFEPYFTTKQDGVGLGLAIVGEIVEGYYGGSLELLPPGRLGGAHFRATLRRRVG